MPLDRENVLETGFVLVGLGFIAGLILVVSGRVAEKTRRARLYAELAPPSGSIPAERHQHLVPSPR